MENSIYKENLFLILYNWNEMSLNQLQKYYNDDLLEIIFKLDTYLNNNLIEVLKNVESSESPIYKVLEHKLSEEQKYQIEIKIKSLIKNELDEISEIYYKNFKLAFRSLMILEKKWNLFKVKDLLSYYLELKEKINIKIKKEIKF